MNTVSIKSKAFHDGIRCRNEPESHLKEGNLFKSVK